MEGLVNWFVTTVEHLKFGWSLEPVETAVVASLSAPMLFLLWWRPYVSVGILAIGAIGLLLSASLLDLVTAALLLAGMNSFLLAVCASCALRKSAQLEQRLLAAELRVQDLKIAEERRRAVLARGTAEHVHLSQVSGSQLRLEFLAGRGNGQVRSELGQTHES